MSYMSYMLTLCRLEYHMFHILTLFVLDYYMSVILSFTWVEYHIYYLWDHIITCLWVLDNHMSHTCILTFRWLDTYDIWLIQRVNT